LGRIGVEDGYDGSLLTHRATPHQWQAFCFLCADLELTPEVREDHAAYIGSWLEVLTLLNTPYHENIAKDSPLRR
jgi:antirestriction protein ArdC